MQAHQRVGQLFDRELFLQVLLRQQAEVRRPALDREPFAASAQVAEAGLHDFFVAAGDLATLAAQFAQCEQAELLVALLAAVEQIVVDFAQRAVERRQDPFQHLLLQAVEEPAAVWRGLMGRRCGGTEGHEALNGGLSHLADYACLQRM
jgi:hypothetical protein